VVFFAEILVELVQPQFFFQKFGLSRLNPIFFPKFWDQPAELNFLSKFGFSRLDPIFFKIWVQLAETHSSPRFVKIQKLEDGSIFLVNLKIYIRAKMGFSTFQNLFQETLE